MELLAEEVAFEHVELSDSSGSSDCSDAEDTEGEMCVAVVNSVEDLGLDPLASPPAPRSRKRGASMMAARMPPAAAGGARIKPAKRTLDLGMDSIQALASARKRARRDSGAPMMGAIASSVIRHGVAFNQGLRSSMEDTARIVPDLAEGLFYAGLFDGHGGANTSKSLLRDLHTRIAARRAGAPALALEAVLREVFLAYDLELLERSRKQQESLQLQQASKGLRCCKARRFRMGPTTPPKQAAPPRELAPCGSGSTGTVVLVEGRELAVAWLGDSRAVLCRGGVAVPLTRDHRATDASEAARVRACGGTVSQGGRLFHDLNLSRAFASFKHKLHRLAPSQRPGDEEDEEDAVVQLRNPLSCVPGTASLEIGDADEFVVVASDGVWDAVSNQEVSRLVRRWLFQWHLTPAEAGAKLLEFALEQGSADNLSAVVLVLRDTI